MRTRYSVCERKVRFASEADAVAAAARIGAMLWPYRCDRGGHFHLTSRAKGKRRAVPRSE